MTSPDSVPLRISVADRESAVQALRQHLDAGRLTSEEFDERSSTARAARTASEIVPLFGDLPAPQPTYLANAQPTWNTYPGASAPTSSPYSATGGVAPAYSPDYTSYQQPEPGSPSHQQIPTVSGEIVPRSQGPLPDLSNRSIRTIQALIWPVAILTMFLINGASPLPILIAIILSVGMGNYYGKNRRRRP